MDVTQLHICSSFFPEITSQEGREAVGLRDYYWEPGSMLKIHFRNGENSLKNLIKEIASEWTRYANLGFTFFDSPNESPDDVDIAIQFWPYGGGQSYIGHYSRKVSRSGQPSMYLPFSGDRGVVLHEFGHALGLMHEHLSPVAGMKWKLDTVYGYYQEVHGWDKKLVDDNVLNELKYEQTNYTLFDRDSIMIYEIPAELTLDGYSIKRNIDLSPRDKLFISEIYPDR